MNFSQPERIPKGSIIGRSKGEIIKNASCCDVPCGDYLIPTVVSNITARHPSYLGKIPYGWAVFERLDSNRLYLVAYHHPAPWRDLLQAIQGLEEGCDLMTTVEANHAATASDAVDAVWI